MEEDKKLILENARSLQGKVWDIAREIGHNPEEGYQEYFAQELLTGFLQEYGFQIKKPLADMDTAFLASFQRNSPGPKIAFLAEYDALPDIGHGCGHNLIGASAAGAAAVISRMPSFSGEIMVIGCPAEETSGAKVALVEAGIFTGLDAALMFHPGSCNVPDISSLALSALEITFLGRVAHMAVADGTGINALDALLDFFQRINKLKRKLGRDERVDGIITEGGKAPNIVPDKAVARFYLRAKTREDLERISGRVLDCAQKAAREFQAGVSWRNYEFSYHEMRTNSVLAETFRNNLLYLGVRDIEPPQIMRGSVDMGNVSHVVPAIHSYLKMGEGQEVPHTAEFARVVLGKDGQEVLYLAVKVLSLTAWDILTDAALRDRMWKEFRQDKGKPASFLGISKSF